MEIVIFLLLHRPVKNTVTTVVGSTLNSVVFTFYMKLIKKILTRSKGNSVFKLAWIRSLMLKLVRSLRSYTNLHQWGIWTVSAQAQAKADT